MIQNEMRGEQRKNQRKKGRKLYSVGGWGLIVIIMPWSDSEKTSKLGVK
jgi:hypothetical protein